MRTDPELLNSLKNARENSPVRGEYEPPVEPPVSTGGEVEKKAEAEAAAAAAWEEVVDPETGNKYYLNRSSGQTSWTKPIDYSI